MILMTISRNNVDSILGVDVRLKLHTQNDKFQDLDKQFQNPIIHREITGEKIYVPFNLRIR